MMGYDKPFSVPLLREASKRGFGPKSLADIRISGAHLDDLRVPSFRKATSAIVNIPDQLRGLGHRMLYLYPELVPEKCTSCGICKEVCPVQAITMVQIPEIDRKRCVKCLCCHEMCPQGAMTVRENTFLKIFRKMQPSK
jgi:formate hydrogenlyase subunit 6/NADH:ubiquinone oxidoreductase subunit I